MTVTLQQRVADVQQVLSGVSGNLSTELVAGIYAHDDAGAWTVIVRGQALPAIWLSSVTPAVGMPCLVALTDGPTGQSTAWVLGTGQRAPSAGEAVTVTVVPAGGTTATVTCNGQTITAYKLSSYAPAVGDIALAQWINGTAYLMGAITPAPAATAVVAYVPPPAPPASVDGYSTFSIVDSGTWSAGYGWNSYYGPQTYTGSGFIPPSSGNWFYGGWTRGLADKATIRRVRFWLGSRRQAGNFNQAVTLHFYVHDANWRGGGEPSRIAGPFDVSVPAGWRGGHLDLPVSVGTSLKSGGGLSIAGDPYAGFACGPSEPNAGSLYVDWSK